MGFSKISKCPFGQAYVMLNNVFDRDDLVRNSPHQYDDVHIIFQKHNQGLNWRGFTLNRECWLLLVGFPFGNRSIIQLTNSVKSFGKLLLWDRVKSSRSGLVVKVRVVELSDIPSYIVIREGNDFQNESWSCPVVII